MYTWFRKGKAAVTSGSDIVRFTGATLTTDPTKPVVGDAFTIDGISLYEIVVIDRDNTGEFIKLQKPYAAATNANINYAIIRLASSTQNNKLVAMAAAAINQKQISLDDMYEWYTSEADAVDFLGPDDTIVTLKTYHKLTQEISDVGGNAGSITIVATNIDKVVDVSNNMSSVIAATTSATQAASSAASALASKNAAASSETSAASSASAALASKNAAASSATAAASSASAALASKNAAESSATAAASSASSALTSKNAAATSEANALTSKNAAASSATAAATSATNAANSATAALASKNAAATSETNAASSAASALASKNAASTSETNALASKNAAATSATAAATSATNSANSATAALASKNAAATSETNAASSASSALASKNAAAISETNAAASAFQSFAMSQAQFEAIRSQNNEEFAASGFVHFGKHRNVLSDPATGAPVNEGLWCYTKSVGSENQLRIGIADGVAYIGGKSKTNNPVVNIAGIVYELSQINLAATNQNHVKFPQAPDGKVTYNKSTGVITNHATVTDAFNAQAADPTNVEVVTDRVDMWGFEAWLEEVSTTNPYIYPNGLIQSQATTMDGIATSASARPVTYYAVFDGDTGSKGKGLNFFALTDAQKKKVLANPKNNLYYLDDGRLVQWRLRQRTIAGAGNGDWSGIDAAQYIGTLTFSPKARILPQGVKDSVAALSEKDNGYRSTNSSINNNPQTGLFTVATTEISAAINGECYFLVCGTVNRLNQGAYHLSFNPSGTALSNWGGGSGGGPWSGSPAIKFTNKSQCFNYIPYTNSTDAGAVIFSGRIGDTSGRPDGRHYDAIYADGQGGVCRDMRYSAYGVDAVDFAEADQKVKNGTYRGFESLVFTKFDRQTASTSASQQYVSVANLTGYFIGQKIHIEVTSGVFDSFFVKGITFGTLSLQLDRFAPRLLNGLMLVETLQNSSVGGSFLQTDVIGNPANILATPQLANGWQGSWIPVIPDGIPKPFPFTKKYLGGNWYRTFTTDNGGTWISQSNQSFDVVNNAHTSALVSNGVMICQYQAFAKQTENAVSTQVYGGGNGIGGVFITSTNSAAWGCVFNESLAGVISKESENNDRTFDTVPLTSYLLRIGANGEFAKGYYNPVHSAFSIQNTVAGRQAVKALNYNVNLNQQAFIQYAYTELKHNGTNWGDDGKVMIVDNQSTKTDLNGNTVLVGTAKLKEPIGWIKNKV